MREVVAFGPLRNELDRRIGVVVALCEGVGRRSGARYVIRRVLPFCCWFAYRVAPGGLDRISETRSFTRAQRKIRDAERELAAGKYHASPLLPPAKPVQRVLR